MLTLMLDLVFKRLKFVMDYLAHERAKLMATEYDRNFLLPMLVKCNQFLNLVISSTFPPTIVLASCKEARKIVIAKLSIFCDCVLNVINDIGSPGVWWVEHAKLHPNFQTDICNS